MKFDIPDHMQHLPRTSAGVPVPHVASWTSERWGVARMDPLVQNRWALFTEGRQGRGRPLLASINEGRQRRSVMEQRCQICDRQLHITELWVTTMAVHNIDVQGTPMVASYAPPTCEPCLEFSALACPAFLKPFQRISLNRCLPVAQLIDPSVEPMRYADRYDSGDNPATRQRLGIIARRHGGLVGHVKLAFQPDDLAAVS